MIARYHHKNLTWVDLENPTQEEVREIMEEYNINPLAADELLHPTLRPKVDVYTDFVYVILHFPVFKHTHNEDAESQEVDFIIGRKYIITTRYDTVDPLHKFSKVFEVNSILDRSDIGDHAGYLFFYMIKKLYKAVGHELEYISDELDQIESNIFDDKEREMVLEISKVSRQLLNFKQATALHKDVLESFDTAARHFFGPTFIYHLKTITGEYYKVRSQIHSLVEMVTEVRETNNSLLTTKQNEVMKVLTIMAFVTLPMSVIASIFGMNAELPIVGQPNDFLYIIGIMVTTALVLFSIFKFKRWL